MMEEVRYVIETALDIHIVSGITVEDNMVKVADISASVEPLHIPVDQIVKITKETVTIEDVTEQLLKKELVQL